MFLITKLLAAQFFNQIRFKSQYCSSYLLNFDYFINSVYVFIWLNKFLYMNFFNKFMMEFIVNYRVLPYGNQLRKQPSHKLVFNSKNIFYSNSFFLNFLKFNNYFYELKGINFNDNWWASSTFLNNKRLQSFIISFYTFSFLRFKYFYKNYYFIKPKIFYYHNFPPFSYVNFSYQRLFDDLKLIKTSIFFLNDQHKKITWQDVNSWQFDFLWFWKNYKFFYFFKKKQKKKLQRGGKILNLSQSSVFLSLKFFLNSGTDISPNKQYKGYDFFSITHTNFFLLKKLFSPKHFFLKFFPIKNIFSASLCVFKKVFLNKVNHRISLTNFLFKNFFRKSFPQHFLNILTLPVIIFNKPKKTYLSTTLFSIDPYTPTVHFSFSDSAFITPTMGFFFVNSSKFFSNVFYDFLNGLRSKNFSFFEKFELHKLIIKNMTKNTFISSFFSDSTDSAYSSLTKSPFSVLDYKTFFLNTLTEFATLPVYENFYYNEKFSWLSNFYKQLALEESLKVNMKISRIKFKPGYMHYWRTARKELKTVFNLKFRYQYKLTKFLMKYNKHARGSTILSLELSLIRVLLESKLFIYKQQATEFIKNQFITVNGWIVTDTNFLLYKYDLVQLILHLKYYIFYKHFINIFVKDKLVVKKLIYFKNKHLNINKQKSSTYSSKLKSKFYIENDIPKYLETDFFTLSVYVLYEPFLVTDFSSEQHWQNRFASLRLYNWKYIT